MKKGTIALIFLLVGGGGFFLTSGPVEGLRAIFAIVATMGVSYFLTPNTKIKRRKTRSKA